MSCQKCNEKRRRREKESNTVVYMYVFYEEKETRRRIEVRPRKAKEEEDEQEKKEETRISCCSIPLQWRGHSSFDLSSSRFFSVLSAFFTFNFPTIYCNINNHSLKHLKLVILN